MGVETSQRTWSSFQNNAGLMYGALVALVVTVLVGRLFWLAIKRSVGCVDCKERERSKDQSDSIIFKKASFLCGP